MTRTTPGGRVFLIVFLLDCLKVDTLAHSELIAETAIRVEYEDSGGGGGEVIPHLVQLVHLVLVMCQVVLVLTRLQVHAR